MKISEVDVFFPTSHLSRLLSLMLVSLSPKCFDLFFLELWYGRN